MPFPHQVLPLARKDCKPRIAIRTARGHLRQRCRGVRAQCPLSGLKGLARRRGIRSTAFRRKPVHRLYRFPEFYSRSFGFGLSLSANINRADVAAPKLSRAHPVVLRKIKRSQTADAPQCVGILLAQHAFAGIQRALQQRLRFGEAVLLHIKIRQDVEGYKCLWIFLAYRVLVGL